MIKRGNTVNFKPQWQDPGDENIVFLTLCDEYDGRIEVEAQIDLPLKPTQIVPVNWLQPS